MTMLLLILGCLIISALNSLLDVTEVQKREIFCNNPESPMNKWVVSELDPETIVPWEDVFSNRFVPDCSGDLILCPKCIEENLVPIGGEEFISENIKAIDKHIIKVHFKSSEYTWENNCGREGNLSICLKHKKQIDFNFTMMN